MTVELFREDQYRLEFTARVVEATDGWVALDRTCFKPSTGVADHCDRGWIDELAVSDVQFGDHRSIRHAIDGANAAKTLEIGAIVAGRVDWDRRHQMMQSHTAVHLVELALRSTHDVQALFVSVGRDHHPVLSVQCRAGEIDLDVVADWIAGVISDDLPMPVDRSECDPNQWIWHLDGLGHRTCSGLHVRSTGEVGQVKLHKVGQAVNSLELSLEVARNCPPKRQAQVNHFM